jgi:uncharacterized protein (DUF433 family)
MSAALSHPHIEKPVGQPARLQRVHRVRVAQIVMDYLAHGWSADEMCRHHPYLTPAETHSAMAYYFDHQEEIDNEIRAEWEQAQRERVQAQRSPFYVRMRAKGLLSMAVLLYMDVHVPQSITDQLRRRGVDVLTAIEDNYAERDD